MRRHKGDLSNNAFFIDDRLTFVHSIYPAFIDHNLVTIGRRIDRHHFGHHLFLITQKGGSE
ncbi:Uncharacterised protein [Vibrio cholerae]|nr:Uncharacterised protein [Vibrio cholerae]CSC70729.1 Uncharacterised protein [Vibrio cholerae]